MVTTRLSAVAQRRLELHRLVRVLLQAVGACGCTATRVAEIGPGSDRVYAVVRIGVVRVTLQTHLVLASDVRRIYVRTQTGARFDLVGNDRNALGPYKGSTPDAPASAPDARFVCPAL